MVGASIVRSVDKASRQALREILASISAETLTELRDGLQMRAIISGHWGQFAGLHVGPSAP